MQCYFLYLSKLLISAPSFPFYPFLGSLMCPTPISATPGVFYASQSPLLLSLVLSPWQYVLLSQINNASLSQIRILTSYCMYAHGTYTGLMFGYWLLAGIIMLYLEAKHFTHTVHPSLPWSVNDYKLNIWEIWLHDVVNPGINLDAIFTVMNTT